NGVVTFDKLYINFVGGNYILSAGTTSFATHAGADTKPFRVVGAPAAQLVFANLVDTSNAQTSFNFTLPAGNTPPLPGINGVVVVALDQFGNLASGFSGKITVGLGTGSAPLGGEKTYTANQGFAVINQAYIDQKTGDFGFDRKASTTKGDKVIKVAKGGL